MSANVRLIARPTVLALLLAALPAFAQAPARPAPAPAPVKRRRGAAREAQADPQSGLLQRRADDFLGERVGTARRDHPRAGPGAGAPDRQPAGGRQSGDPPWLRPVSMRWCWNRRSARTRTRSTACRSTRRCSSVSFDPDSVDALLAGAGLKLLVQHPAQADPVAGDRRWPRSAPGDRPADQRGQAAGDARPGARHALPAAGRHGGGAGGGQLHLGAERPGAGSR